MTEFSSVEYNFVSEDGKMVSNAAYNSKVFGSGWFNADGKVVAMEGNGVKKDQDHDLVKVGAPDISGRPGALFASAFLKLIAWERS